MARQPHPRGNPCAPVIGCEGRHGKLKETLNAADVWEAERQKADVMESV